MKRLALEAIDRLSAALGRSPYVPPAPDPLDTYGREAPSAQQTVDIFKGAWSSAFPAEYAVQAGGSELFRDSRLQQLIDRVGGVRGLRVLELGPLEGGHSWLLEHAGAASVLAIEACALSYLKCLIVKDITDLKRVTFRFGNFLPFLRGSGERFDLILASGVLYHQRDPVACLREIARCTDLTFIWTHYYRKGFAADRLKAADFRPVPRTHPDGVDLYRLDYDAYLPNMKYRGGVDDHSHWMTREGILSCLRDDGLSEIEVVSEQLEHPYGPNFTLLARRPQGR